MARLLDGLSLLLLEDEFLIAMDVEQICRDHGAENVTIARTIDEAEAAVGASTFDAAIVDIMLGGTATLGFAARLQEAGVPFIFASGYTEIQEISRSFRDVSIVAKPYAGDDLVEALAAAHRQGTVTQ